eukprot:NODE_1054_length_1034_cov_12.138920_g1009_i0.p1 GENE.NODE_1054_length_1034_cov_12.138920_g1009_i0~~NODE_1054_length_1034_cov_12.138920_g1009_i0.p1  ORF type:complete len:256 (+),score=40.08 NODE_1054_length_1034_cov_12.138920_g1009_i0:49-768(+)
MDGSLNASGMLYGMDNIAQALGSAGKAMFAGKQFPSSDNPVPGPGPDGPPSTPASPIAARPGGTCAGPPESHSSGWYDSKRPPSPPPHQRRPQQKDRMDGPPPRRGYEPDYPRYDRSRTPTYGNSRAPTPRMDDRPPSNPPADCGCGTPRGGRWEVPCGPPRDQPPSTRSQPQRSASDWGPPPIPAEAPPPGYARVGEYANARHRDLPPARGRGLPETGYSSRGSETSRGSYGRHMLSV